MTLPSGFARICAFFSGAGAPSGACVTYCIDNADDDSASALASEAQGIWVTSTLVASLCSDVKLSQILVKKGPDETGPSAVLATDITGTGSGETSNPGLAYLVHKVTNLGGRRGRGRMFLPGVSEGAVSPGGMISTGNLSGMQTDLTSFLNLYTAASHPLVLEHFDETKWELQNGQPVRVPIKDTAPNPTLITALQCDTKAATQRRRLRR